MRLYSIQDKPTCEDLFLKKHLSKKYTERTDAHVYEKWFIDYCKHLKERGAIDVKVSLDNIYGYQVCIVGFHSLNQFCLHVAHDGTVTHAYIPKTSSKITVQTHSHEMYLAFLAGQTLSKLVNTQEENDFFARMPKAEADECEYETWVSEYKRYIEQLGIVKAQVNEKYISATLETTGQAFDCITWYHRVNGIIFKLEVPVALDRLNATAEPNKEFAKALRPHNKFGMHAMIHLFYACIARSVRMNLVEENGNLCAIVKTLDGDSFMVNKEELSSSTSSAFSPIKSWQDWLSAATAFGFDSVATYVAHERSLCCPIIIVTLGMRAQSIYIEFIAQMPAKRQKDLAKILNDKHKKQSFFQELALEHINKFRLSFDQLIRSYYWLRKNLLQKISPTFYQPVQRAVAAAANASSPPETSSDSCIGPNQNLQDADEKLAIS